MADGPVIQKAGKATVRLGIGMSHVLKHGENFSPARQYDTSQFLMGYANPVECYDYRPMARMLLSNMRGFRGLMVC
jgi:tryptophan synthase alpha subunit